jgi:hypothetical protein
MKLKFSMELSVARMVSWESRKKPIVTLSSVEVEYVADKRTTSQEVWMRIMFK